MDGVTRCVDCRHFQRCAALIESLTGLETKCDFVPSRFEREPGRWARSTNKALAVGRGSPGAAQIGRHLGARGPR